MFNVDTLDHSKESTYANRAFADVFMAYARQNVNSCGDFSACQTMIIENYPLTVTDTFYGNVFAF